MVVVVVEYELAVNVVLGPVAGAVVAGVVVRSTVGVLSRAVGVAVEIVEMVVVMSGSTAASDEYTRKHQIFCLPEQ